MKAIIGNFQHFVNFGKCFCYLEPVKETNIIVCYNLQENKTAIPHLSKKLSNINQGGQLSFDLRYNVVEDSE